MMDESTFGGEYLGQQDGECGTGTKKNVGVHDIYFFQVFCGLENVIYTALLHLLGFINFID